MDPTISSSGSYLATRLGYSLGVGSSGTYVQADDRFKEAAQGLSSSSLQLNYADKNYLLLRDALDEWSSIVTVVQLSDADLDQLGGFLERLQTEYAALSILQSDGSPYEQKVAEIQTLEQDMSRFIGQRAVQTSDVSMIQSDAKLTQRYFQTVNIPRDSLSEEDSFSLAVIEVDMGRVLTEAHSPKTCPICMSQLGTSNGLEPLAAPATNTTNVTGAVASNSGADYIETLRLSAKWDLSAGETLSYSYYTGSVPYTGYPAGGVNPPAGAAPLGDANTALLDLAFQAWDNAVAFSFEKVIESGTTVGEIRNAYTNDTNTPPGAAAFAYGPGNSVVNGDIWYGQHISTNLSFTPGGYGFMTALHEIGHAIGLSHPFDGSSASGATLATSRDIMRNTLMSYTSSDRNFYLVESGGGLSARGIYASTPMIYDIGTVEHLYGASTTANSGNTVYSWLDDTPRIIQTLVDSGGADTIDASNQTRRSVINLNPGSFSSIGIWTEDEQVTYWVGRGFSEASIRGYINALNASVSAPSGKILYTGEDNVAIAYSTTIENAIGGRGNDTLTGNSANNVFKGNQGNDTIDGGGGTNTAVYRFNFADYTISNSGGTITVTHNVAGGDSDGTDTLTNIQFLEFADLTYEVATTSTSPTAAGGALAAAVEGAARVVGDPLTAEIRQVSGGGGGGGGFSGSTATEEGRRNFKRFVAVQRNRQYVEMAAQNPELSRSHMELIAQARSSGNYAEASKQLGVAMQTVAVQRQAVSRMAQSFMAGFQAAQSRESSATALNLINSVRDVASSRGAPGNHSSLGMVGIMSITSQEAESLLQ